MCNLSKEQNGVIKHISIFVLLAILAAIGFIGCDKNSATPPLLSPSPPPPISGEPSELSIEAIGKVSDESILEIEGDVKREYGDMVNIDVYIDNASQETVIVVKTLDDGSFVGEIDVQKSDLVIIVAVDSDTEQESNTISAVVPAVTADVTEEGETFVIFSDALNNDYDNDGYNDAEDESPATPD